MMRDDRNPRGLAPANWTLRLVLGVAALSLVVLGLGIAWVVDHSVAPSLIALAEVLR